MKLFKKIFGGVKVLASSYIFDKTIYKYILFSLSVLFWSFPASAMVLGDWFTNLKTNGVVPFLEFIQYIPTMAGVVSAIMFIMGLMKYNKTEGREPSMKYLVICFVVTMIGIGFTAWVYMASETGFGTSSSSEKITIQ